ncbi:Holliday junction branch migration DNA helicase RuvB [Candidatus Peregrinibacteria bacterium]|nr:Holliday junction branch migration DNA helicase RuvB [Candidatus Peregrinibacteria bacterium]
MIEEGIVNNKRVIDPSEKSPVKRTQEISLRPRTLNDYIGQNEIKKNLLIAIAAAKKRKEPLEHILVHGPAGLGKTTLSHIISNEMGVNIKMTSGPALEKQGDLASILTNLKEFDVLFIDEIHRLRPAIEEVLYTAMEDFGIDIIIGQGPSARSVRLSIPRFTLIGATTKMSMLSSPLRDRFGNVFKLNFYSDEDILAIVKRTSRILNFEIDEDAAAKIAKSSRQTPRIANRLLKRIRDFAEVNNQKKITLNNAKEGLASLGIDELGLDQQDRDLLKILIEKFNGGPVGISAIAAAASEEQATIEEVYEPFLIKLGFVERTQRGRTARKPAYQHLGLEYNPVDFSIK